MTLLAAAEGVQVWPITVAGWATLAMAALGLLAALYTWFKNLAHLNGLGERVTAVEQAQKQSEAREAQFLRSVDKVLAAQDALLERVARNDKATEDCRDVMQQYALEVGVKIDELRKLVNDEGRRAGERLQAVETEIKVTRDLRRTA